MKLGVTYVAIEKIMNIDEGIESLLLYWEKTRVISQAALNSFPQMIKCECGNDDIGREFQAHWHLYDLSVVPESRYGVYMGIAVCLKCGLEYSVIANLKHEKPQSIETLGGLKLVGKAEKGTYKIRLKMQESVERQIDSINEELQNQLLK